jgi:hypothetical protein
MANTTTEYELQQITEAVMKNSSIRQLNLIYSKEEIETAILIGLNHPASHLIALTCYGGRVTGSANLCHILHSLIIQSSTLQKLELRRFSFKEEQTSPLFHAMMSPNRCSTIKMLTLKDCDFEDLASVQLFQGMVVVSSLSTLQLCGSLEFDDDKGAIYDILSNILSVIRHDRNCDRDEPINHGYLKCLDLDRFESSINSRRFCHELVQNETIEYLLTPPMKANDKFIMKYIPHLNASLKTLVDEFVRVPTCHDCQKSSDALCNHFYKM